MLISLITTYKYWFVFLGTLVGGELVIIPVIYIASLGGLDLLYVVLIIGFASFIADSFWYWVGRRIPRERWSSWPIIRSSHERIAEFSRFFQGHGFSLVFLSKFMYGTRTATQVLSGVYKLNFWKYAGSGFAGVIVFSGTLAALAAVLNLGLSAIEDTAFSIQISITAFVVLVVLLHVLVKKFFKKHTSED